jgi:protein TonB
MLRNLLESNAPRQRRRAGTVASIVVHTVMIGGAIVASASAKPRPGDQPPPRDPTMILTPPSEVPPRRSRGPSGESARRSDVIRGPIRDIRGPSLHYLDSLARPTVDVRPESLIEGDPWPNCAFTTHCGRSPDVEARGAGGDQPLTLATVERPAALRSPLRPRYPDQLRAAGVTGRVVVRLVVDTLGRVEPETVVIRESSHDLFASAVRAVLPALRFVPAEAGGRRARMLVELPFEFRLDQ